MAQLFRVLKMKSPFISRVTRFCDYLTEGAIYFILVLSPWIFGSTLDWTIWLMNSVAYVIGAALVVKWALRWRGARFDRESRKSDPEGDPTLMRADLGEGSLGRGTGYLTWLLAGLTLFALGYCLIGAINARATYRGWHLFTYHESIEWLPHSYDSKASWFTFWTCLGLGAVFWGTRDWLLHASKPARRSRSHSRSSAEAAAMEPETIRSARHSVPTRLQRLLWVLCINGALLGLEGILQRLDGTSKLLWLIEPTRNNTAESQFGPFAYRANAASYINLIWPITLGFWFVLRAKSKESRRGPTRVGSGSHSILLPGAVLMASCPIIATTRGGSTVAVLSLALMGVILWRGSSRSPHWTKTAIVIFIILVLAFAGILGGKELLGRFKNVFADEMSGRPEIYKNAVEIAHEFPWLGTGAGSFGAIYQMYREPNQTWAGYAHDDWLEMRIDLGWIGFGAVVLMLMIIFARWFAGGGLPLPPVLASAISLALAGSLLHAKFDFPFQIYSIQFLFVLLCAILFSSGRVNVRGE